jgi:TRAP-type mannitol/chloroaromatic compound transport system substrate-binding protein
MRYVKPALAALAATGLMTGVALAETTKLRIQTHYAPETVSGKLATQFVDDVQVMSNGEIQIEMFYASSVVKSVETFDAAATGILDCDMTGGAYQTGKNPAFQFVGDIMGGYDTPYQQLSWLYHGDGFAAADSLYNKYGMKLVGWWVYGQESLSSSKPIAGETGIIDGADASGIANNVGLGLYDIVKHANYPGFHSMPSDHLACNKAKWDAMPESHRRIMDTAMQKLALQTALTFEVKNAEAVSMLQAKGVNIYNWSKEDRATFRAAAQKAWDGWAKKTPEADALVKSHRAYLKQLGLIE